MSLLLLGGDHGLDIGGEGVGFNKCREEEGEGP